jgi:dihydrofolate reductase
MRKIVAALFMSLDGVVESPEKWTIPYFNDEVWQVTSKGMAASDTLLLGRRTYEEFAAYWPDKTADDSPYADHLNSTPKVVVSTTLKSVTWRNSRLITGDIVGHITKLKEQPGKNITILGSATLVRWLLRKDLLDQLGLLLYPIVVGTGKRLFEDWTAKAPLNLVESRALSNGILSLTYEPGGR